MPWIRIIEASYAFAADEHAWLRGVLDACRPVLDHGVGVLGYTFEPGATRHQLRSFVGDEIPTGVHRASIQALVERGSDEMHRRALGTVTCSTMTQLIADLPHDLEMYLSVMGALGVADALGIVAIDPTGYGCILSAPLRKRGHVSRERASIWARVAAHIVAGYRLHRLGRPSEQEPEPDAVLDERNRLQHACGDATTSAAREALRDAAVRLMRARAGRGTLRDPAEGVAAWRALVSGRWSLVDHFDSDGRRFLVAKRNDPDARPLEDLTLRERQVAAYASFGHSNKLIAYELGLSPSTVAAHLAAAAAKLGVHSRAQLIGAFASSAGTGGAKRKP